MDWVTRAVSQRIAGAASLPRSALPVRLRCLAAHCRRGEAAKLRGGRKEASAAARRFRCRTQRQVVLGRDQRGRPLNAVPLRFRRAGLGARRTAFTPLGWAPARPPEKQWGGCGGGWEWGGLDTADGVIGGDDDDDDRPGPRGLPLP